MRVRPISFLSAISVAALFLVAPSHRGNAELPQSTQAGPSTAPMDLADATKRIAQLAEDAEYKAAIELAGQLAEAVKARLGAHHAEHARILYNLGDILTLAGRRAEAVARYREAIAIFEELAAADQSNFEWPRYLIGAYERIIKAGDRPAADTEKALAIVKRLRSQGRLEPWEKDWPAELELKLRRIALENLVTAGTVAVADALTMSERWAKRVQLSATAKGTSSSDIAAAFGNVAWLALLARRPATALAASAQRWVATGEGSREHGLQRCRDVDDQVRHRDQAAEHLDILATWGMVDVDEDVVGGMDRALVHQHGMPAVRLAGQHGVDAELPQHASGRAERGDGPVGVASDHGHGEGQEVAVSAEGDRLPHAPEVEREVLERRVAADGARKPRQRDVLGGGNRKAALGTLAQDLFQECRFAAPRAAGDFDDHP